MAERPNIVFFYWDNFGWGELGCYGGGVLRGAPTPRIDGLAAEGRRLLNFNVEAQCTPSRSALLTGRHAIRSGTQAVPIAGGPDGLTRWEVTIAQALSDAGYATGMWGKWHLGSDPEQPEPGRLRLRRGRVVPAHRRRGIVDHAVLLPERGGDRRTLCRPHEDPARAGADFLEEEGRKARGARHLRRGVPRGVRSQDHRVGN